MFERDQSKFALFHRRDIKTFSRGRKDTEYRSTGFIFFCNVTAQVFLPTEVGKLWKAINAKHKQMTTVRNNVTQLFKNSVEFAGNKAINHERYLI